MARANQEITDAELAVLEALWGATSATVRHLTLVLYPRGTPSDFATVQKLLERLERKGAVRRDRAAWPHQFTAQWRRGDLIQRRLRATADRFCDGSVMPLLTQLLRADSLTREDRDAVRRLLDALDE